MAEKPAHAYVYRARSDRVIDGDTVVCTIDAGFGITIHKGNEGAHLRLLGVDTPERNESGWDDARRFTAEWMAQAQIYATPLAFPLLIATEKADSFGRYLADIWRISDGRHLNADLLASGNAVEWTRA